MKTCFGVPLTERVVSPDHLFWTGRKGNIVVSLENRTPDPSIFPGNPWRGWVQVQVFRAKIRAEAEGQSERALRKALKEQLGQARLDVQTALELLGTLV